LKKKRRKLDLIIDDIIPEHDSEHALSIVKTMFWKWDLKKIRDYYGEGEIEKNYSFFCKFLMTSRSRVGCRGCNVLWLDEILYTSIDCTGNAWSSNVFTKRSLDIGRELGVGAILLDRHVFVGRGVRCAVATSMFGHHYWLVYGRVRIVGGCAPRVCRRRACFASHWRCW
jgi:hypothetical protein